MDMNQAGTEGSGLADELRHDAGQIGDKAKTRAYEQVDQRKGDAARQAKSVASALDRAAGELDDSPQWLQSAFRSGSQTLQKLADTVEQKDARDLGRELQRIAREKPVAFLGTCALLGFAAARVLKAGAGQAAGQDRPTEPQSWDASGPVPAQDGTGTTGGFTQPMGGVEA